MYWSYHYWGMHLFWWIFWIALVVLLASTGWPRSYTTRDTAIDTLRTRYASGEIDAAEYNERLAVLRGVTRSDLAQRGKQESSSAPAVSSVNEPR
jgi:putative membrane protein